MEREQAADKGKGRRLRIDRQARSTVKLRLRGQLATGDGLDIAGRLNAFVAYWNTYLQLNKQPDQNKKIKSATGPIRGLGPRRRPQERPTPRQNAQRKS